MLRLKMSAKRTPRNVDDDDTPSTYPWPREEGTIIDLKDPKIPRHALDKWDSFDSKHYNALLAVSILPTRFVNAREMRDLGIHEDVQTILHAIGIDELAYETDSFYPDLVRQFLASVQITYSNPDHPSFETENLCFFASGTKHTISLDEFTEALKLENEPTDLKFPNQSKPTKEFWTLIAAGDYKPRSANQSSIRNLAIRVAAKALGALIFSKECTSRVSTGELHFLYKGIEDEVWKGAPEIPTAEVTANPGFVLAKALTEKKAKALLKEGNRTTERCGSLFTPVFEQCDVDLTPYQVNDAPEYIDLGYLCTCQILRDESTYAFQDREGNTLYCPLPQPSITTLQTFENIKFLPGPEHLCADPRAPPEQTDIDEDDVEDVTLPTYDLGPLEDDADGVEYMRWVVDSHRKNNSLMQKILSTLTSGCIVKPTTGSRKKRTRQPHRSTQAGTSTTGGRLGRNIRSIDRSDSEKTE